MPRRYKLGPDGEVRRAWGGKLPEEFSQRDVLAFMADTDLLLGGDVSAETLSAIHAAGYDYKGGAVIPRPGKEDLSMANTQTAVQTAEELAAAQEEMRRLIFEAPIAELAEHQGISVDEAVALRVEQNLAAATIPIEVSVRPIEPQGKLIGFASVNFGGVVVDDFKVVNGQNALALFDRGLAAVLAKGNAVTLPISARAGVNTYAKPYLQNICAEYGADLENVVYAFDDGWYKEHSGQILLIRLGVVAVIIVAGAVLWAFGDGLLKRKGMKNEGQSL